MLISALVLVGIIVGILVGDFLGFKAGYRKGLIEGFEKAMAEQAGPELVSVLSDIAKAAQMKEKWEEQRFEQEAERLALERKRHETEQTKQDENK